MILMISSSPLMKHQEFLKNAMPVIQQDARILGVAAAGSWITQSMDQYSDLDLIIVVDCAQYQPFMSDRTPILERMGKLLVSFTGEHVGEPRVFICLYGDPLLHVDVKFIALDDLKSRIEDPAVLWERNRALSKMIESSEPKYPMLDLQWIEDRFWVWIHYVAQRLGRGELFEVIDFLSYLRSQVLGPLALASHSHLPRGVRRLEVLASADLPAFMRTISSYDRESCGAAIRASISLYSRLREQASNQILNRRIQAETAAVAYLDQVIAKLD